MAKEIISGVGARYGAIFNLDTDGLPLPAVASRTPAQGSLIQGIKTLAVSDPEVQRIVHYGDDQPFATDQLAPADVGSFTVTTAKSNLTIDAMIQGAKVRTADTLPAAGGNTSKRGSEPQLMFYAYRQALDTTKGSATFGKLRQWHLRIYPSIRMTPVSESFEQAATDKSYSATPTSVSATPWNELLNETNWGIVTAEYIDMVTDYQPRVNTYRGNGTLVAFDLSHPPVAASQLHVWVDGTVTAPSSVNVSTANPSFTLGSAAANNKLVFAIIETNAPGNS